MTIWLFIKICSLLLVLGCVGYVLVHYLAFQNSPSIMGGGYDKKMKEKYPEKAPTVQEKNIKDMVYLLEAIGNDAISIKTLQERLPDKEWKILATDLNFLMEKGFIAPIVSSSTAIATTYTVSTKGKVLLGGQ